MVYIIGLTGNIACGKSQVQQLTARTGWVHQSSRVVHFGLGQCAGPVDASTSWPTGQVARFTLAANAYYTMTPTGQPKALLSTGKRLSAKR